MTLALRTEGANMREIDLIPIRLHKGEPTWETIDELIDHIDSLAGVTPEEYEEAVDESYLDGKVAGYDSGYEDGKWDAGD